MRCFVALELSQETRKSLEELVKKASELELDATFPSPAQLHVTLAFLGEKNDFQASKIISALEKISLETTPFSFTVEGTGLLPNDSFVRVWYADIPPSTQLSQFQKKIAESLSVKQERPFLGHVTLARVKSRNNLGRLVSLKNEFSQTFFGENLVNEVCFKKSLLSPCGPQYENLRAFPLQGSE